MWFQRATGGEGPNRGLSVCFQGVACTIVALLLTTVFIDPAAARRPIRNDFFSVYPSAVGTQLDELPSNASHCGVCHFDFNGGGPRNAYGLQVEIGRNNGLSNVEAILAIENDDSDVDGKSNLVEITDTIHFGNTPTFPGLSSANVNSTVNIPLAEVTPYLTPTGGTDTTPPSVTVLYPNGGESVSPNGITMVSFVATDASGVATVNVYLSDDDGVSWKPVGLQASPSSDFAWFVPNLPGGTNRIRVEAIDNAGNPGEDTSDAVFTIEPVTTGIAPVTLRDVELPGTQPFEGAILDNPQGCSTCHGGYDLDNEPWHNWAGSMMGQAMRDPLFQACLAVAEQDAPSVGDLCLRCHTPGGWQEGRSTDTSGGMLTAKDYQGIHCDFCHRGVDRNYVDGVSPAQDPDVLADVDPLPLQYGNGQFISDPAALRRGPFADAQADHQFVESPFHREADMCGTCHDVSNPVFQQTGPGDYAPTAFNEKHPDMDLRNMFPVERTFSEWSQSEYAASGVYAPQFAGNKADGIVSTCQDCHMRDVNARGAVGGVRRSDMPLHDMMGGNHFIPDVLPSMYPGDVDVTQLQDAKQRAIRMLQLAATLEVTPTEYGVDVRVWNETGHKLPSGYPEGRRIWLHVQGRDANQQVVYESGFYDFDTAELHHDQDLKIYEIHSGLSPALAGALGMPAGPSFHFVLVDSVYVDNRIPPRGFTNAAFEAIQSPPVAYSYADGQYWDDTEYHMTIATDSVTVTLYYQSTSKEYIEFLRDANTTTSAGDDLYAAWVAQGMAPPVVMQQITLAVDVTVDVSDDGHQDEILSYAFGRATPNPFRGRTSIAYSLPQSGSVRIAVYDVRGRQVRMLLNEVRGPGRYHIEWDGRDQAGNAVASGIYLVRYQAENRSFTQRVMHLR